MGDDESLTERPHPRRAASDSNTLAISSTVVWPRSPTPPPVPRLPSQYRPKNPSSDGHFFASSLLSALGSRGNEKLAGAIKTMLGVVRPEREDMRGELAGVYDRWRLERGMRKVSLEIGSTLAEQVSPRTISKSLMIFCRPVQVSRVLFRRSVCPARLPGSQNLHHSSPPPPLRAWL